MMIFSRSVTLGVVGVLLSLPAHGQSLSPDATVGTLVAPNPSQFVVTGGTQRNGTLFHSFETFSPQDASVLFQLSNSQSGVNFVVGRVTGLTSSLIDGSLELTGGDRPTLILLNPNGFTFGSNARLDLPGSFLASTAESLLFDQTVAGEDQSFSAVNPGTAPLLTLGIPTGLQMGQNAGTLEIQGQGHGWNRPRFRPFVNTNPSLVGLQVQPGQALVLIGQDVKLTGGAITAPDSQVELIAVGRSPNQIDIQLEPEIWTLSPKQDPSGALNLTQAALIQGGGTARSPLRLQGESLALNEGSIVLSENRGGDTAQPLVVDLAQQLDVSGISATTGISSGLYSLTKGSGQGSNLEVKASQVQLNDGGSVLAETTGSGNSGAVAIQAQRLETNVAPQASDLKGVPLVGTLALAASGNSGDVMIDVETINIAGSGVISAASFSGSSGNSGNVYVNASDSVEISSNDGQDATIAASAVTPSSNAGNITLNTGRLLLRNGATVGSSTFGMGQGGSIEVTATEFIDLEGRQLTSVRGISEGSGLRTTGTLLAPAIRRILGVPDQVTGDAGDIRVTTPTLLLRNGAEITVRHDSVGDAGQLEIQADTIQLVNGGTLSARTVSGNGGDIVLDADLLSLVGNSTITTDAGGTGSGGDIRINSTLLLGADNGDIIANAVRGQGGNIQIEAQSLIGLHSQTRRTVGNDITASSELGINGTVAINAFSTDDSALGQVQLPKQLLDESTQIAQQCDPDEEVAFRLAGRGGLALNPMDGLAPRSLWTDNRDSSPQQIAAARSHSSPVEALTWRRNRAGQVSLVTLGAETRPELPVASCTVGNAS